MGQTAESGSESGSDRHERGVREWVMTGREWVRDWVRQAESGAESGSENGSDRQRVVQRVGLDDQRVG